MHNKKSPSIASSGFGTRGPARPPKPSRSNPAATQAPWAKMRTVRLRYGANVKVRSYPKVVLRLASRRELAQDIRPALAMSEPAARRRQDRRRCGAPCKTRTCDLLVRRAKKGVNRGQRETAAPRFSACLAHFGQRQNTSSRSRLSVICQSMLKRPDKARQRFDVAK
jgi:hypothetical protein